MAQDQPTVRHLSPARSPADTQLNNAPSVHTKFNISGRSLSDLRAVSSWLTGDLRAIKRLNWS